MAPYDPKIMVVETQMIVVSIQYRVSLFGFLYMDHELAPGNQGLLDQNMAIKWVYENIEYFGGDKTRITLFGESAGAASVSYHLLSNMSSSYFASAILQSGGANSEWAFHRKSEALKVNTEMLKSLNCTTSRTENKTVDLIECAKKMDAKEALEKSSSQYSFIDAWTSLPVVDNFFLFDEPTSLLQKGNFKKVFFSVKFNYSSSVSVSQ